MNPLYIRYGTNDVSDWYRLKRAPFNVPQKDYNHALIRFDKVSRIYIVVWKGVEAFRTLTMIEAMIAAWMVRRVKMHTLLGEVVAEMD
jgi:hypothetical protein